MDVVDTWTGRHATALRRALRLTNEALAEELGTAVRTVAKWNADPDLVPVPDMQRALDTVLSRAPEPARARFTLLLAADLPASAPPVTEAAAAELAGDDSSAAAALAWVDQAAGWQPETASRLLAERAALTDRRRIRQVAAARARVGRDDLAAALAAYYGTDDEHGVYRGVCAGQRLTTSVLTRPSWLDLRLPLGAGREHLRLSPGPAAPIAVDQLGAAAAVDRIATGLQADLRMVNAPIYSLTDVTVSAGGIAGMVSLAGFFDYALTLDLLEAELTDAIGAGLPPARGHLPLRDRYLPDLASVLNVAGRLCAGGPPALCAIARPATRNRGPDYLLLIQERSGRVLNSARRLAVIPKSFHGPLVDYAEDAQIHRSVEREMEEELFGRDDVDSVLSGQRSADPMHRSRLSVPMRSLMDRPDDGSWRMECTGYGYNLLTGNYEFATLIAVHDETWWAEYGGHIEANWESASLRRYSTRDRDAITALAFDPAWSNEGLFALLQGLRRLAEIDSDRTDLPAIDWET